MELRNKNAFTHKKKKKKKQTNKKKEEKGKTQFHKKEKKHQIDEDKNWPRGWLGRLEFKISH